MIITIPQRISIDVDSYQFFANLYADTVLTWNDSVHLNFEMCSYFEGNMCAMLGSILEDLKDRGNLVFLTKLSTTMKGFLSRNGFLERFLDTSVRNPAYSTSILYKRFPIDDEDGIKEYVQTELFSKPKLPFVSDQLKGKMIESIFEIYANALTHGKSRYVFSCGQLLSKQTLNFTFVDMGVTVKNQVNNYLTNSWAGAECISWATKDNNTTKTGNHSGGLGLKIIQEFLSLNNGVLQIVSGEGFWEKSKNGIQEINMNSSFPGTAVNLVFNLADTKSYFLSGEVNHSVNNIF